MDLAVVVGVPQKRSAVGPGRTRQVNDERIGAVRSGAHGADVITHSDF